MASLSESIADATVKRSRFAFLLSPRARTWLLTVPLHLLAFVVLYLASARIMEREIMSLAGIAAGERLERLNRELESVMLAPVEDPARAHGLRALIASKRDINLQLFTTPATFIGPPLELPERVRDDIARFFSGNETQRLWMSSEGEKERLRALRRITAGEQCARCHEPGKTMAVAAMSLDLTLMVARVRSDSRRNLGLLILAWAMLLGGINVLVRRSVERLGERFEAQLAAVEAGEPEATDGPALVLDPASARLNRSLQEFLDRRRRRQAELATRLEHSDQLASLGRLAAGLAHEIKNPLAGIQGALEILREDSIEKANVQLYDDMLGELGRVNTTLRLLLESARPSEPRLVPTHPERLIKETIYLLRPGFAGRGVTLRYEIAPGTREAMMDGSKMRQVLINLIQNAAEAMVNGGKIVVRAGPFPESAQGLILAVEDDGPGISEDAQSKIFEPFFTTKFSGTGLGLAIAKRLVDQHGGSLQVDSEPGRGTTFYILLPPPTCVLPARDADMALAD